MLKRIGWSLCTATSGRFPYSWNNTTTTCSLPVLSLYWLYLTRLSLLTWALSYLHYRWVEYTVLQHLFCHKLLTFRDVSVQHPNFLCHNPCGLVSCRTSLPQQYLAYRRRRLLQRQVTLLLTDTRLFGIMMLYFAVYFPVLISSSFLTFLQSTFLTNIILGHSIA